MANASTVVRRLAEMATIGQEFSQHIPLLARGRRLSDGGPDVIRVAKGGKNIHVALLSMPTAADSTAMNATLFIVNAGHTPADVEVHINYAAVAKRKMEAWGVAAVPVAVAQP
jgi:hypothetical protein